MPRKLDPGLAQTYSKPSDFRTSTMKSEPVRSAVRISGSDGGAVSAAADMIGVADAGARAAGDCASAATGGVAIAAAPASDARFRKPRRSIGLLPDGPASNPVI